MPDQTIQQSINSDIEAIQVVGGSITDLLSSIDGKKELLQQKTQKINDIKLDIEDALEEVGIKNAKELYFEQYADEIRKLELPFTILVPMF